MLHYTAMQSADAALERLCDPAFEVSAHYLIARDGRAFALVPESARAWHAGAGGWAGASDDVNSHSIGIELDNDGASPFPARQMGRLEALLPEIMARWQIGPEGVIAHSDLAPARKQDPGPRFDWRRLARAGLALWPDKPGDAGCPIADSLRRIGYPHASPDALLAAFRLRFRPWARGPETADDRAWAAAVADLASRRPDAPKVHPMF